MTIPTDVLERDYTPSYELIEAEDAGDRRSRIDPIVPGVSIGHTSTSAGTAGAIVFDRETGDECLLSNWHVLHTAEGEIGDPFVQPGRHDDSRTDQNIAGVLVRSHLGIAGDCAIGRVEGRGVEKEIFDLGLFPSRIARPELGDFVIKSGRTTGVTRGVVRQVEKVTKIRYRGMTTSVEIGGFEIGPVDPNSPDEISMGGDSGSAWMICDEDGAATDIMVGLHFAGESGANPDEHAVACHAHSVFKKLNIGFIEPAGPEAEDEVQAEDITGPGYDEHFLPTPIPTPRLSGGVLRDAFKLNRRPFLSYTHFSVCQSKSRRLPRLVAWNIDGRRRRSVRRVGFRLDPRVPSEFQAGNELYRGHSLQRGHIARRADLTWGSLAEARQANRDSFFFTNIAPQQPAFNQSSRGGLWGRLENAVLDEVDVDDLKVSVMAGPVFSDDDPLHRGVAVPRDYWKLIAFKDLEDGRVKVRAFILTQRDLLTNLETLELDAWRLFQVSISRLSRETELDFSALEPLDAAPSERMPESLTESPDVREVFGRGQLFL